MERRYIDGQSYSRRTVLGGGLVLALGVAVGGGTLTWAEGERRIVVWGNSILHAVGASSSAQGCCALLAAGLGGRLDGRNEWVGGIAALSAGLPVLLTGAAPSLLLIHTATHDMPSRHDGSPDATLDRRARLVGETVSKIRAVWGTPVIVLGPWGVPPGHGYNRRPVAAVAGRAQFIDLVPIFAARGNRRSRDNWHPGDAGHAAIARAMIAAAAPLWPANTATPLPPTSTPIPTRTAGPTSTPRPIPTLGAGWGRQFIARLQASTGW